MKNNKETKYIDYLDEDDPIPGQKFVCLSFLSPEGIKNCSLRGLKVRGVYATKEEADKRALEIQGMDQNFDVFVGDIGKWLPWDPDPNSIDDQVYKEKGLNEIMKGHKEHLQKAKIVHNQHKDDMIRQAAYEEQNKENKTADRLRKKLEEKKKKQRMNDLINKQSNVNDKLKENEDFIKKEKDKIVNTQKEINEKSEILETVEDKLKKIQDLYSKLHSKK